MSTADPKEQCPQDIGVYALSASLLRLHTFSCHLSCLIPPDQRQHYRLVFEGQRRCVRPAGVPVTSYVLNSLLKDLSLDHLEFNVLPSGLHLVEQDVVYAPTLLPRA